MANVSVRIAPIVTKSCSFPTLFPTFEVAEMISLDQEAVLAEAVVAVNVALPVIYEPFIVVVVILGAAETEFVETGVLTRNQSAATRSPK
jgi:hypothetical protein